MLYQIFAFVSILHYTTLHRCGDTSYLGKGTHQSFRTTGLAIQGMVMKNHSSMLLNQTSGILLLLFEPTQGCRMDLWAHQSSNLSCVCQFTLNDCVLAAPIQGLSGYRVAYYPVACM